MKPKFFSNPTSLGIIFFILIIPLISYQGVLDKQITIRFIAWSVLLVIVSLTLLFKKARIRFSVSLKVVLIILFLNIIVSVFSVSHTINKPDAYFLLGKQILFFLSVFLFYQFFSESKNNVQYFSIGVLLLSFLIISIAFFQLFEIAKSETGITHNALYNVNITFAHKNLFLQFLFLCFPFCLFIAFAYNKRIVNVLAGIVSLLIFVLILLLNTRSVWAALVAAVLSGGILLLLIKVPLKIKTGKLISIITGIFLIMVLSLLVYSKLDSTNTLQMQFKSIANTEYGSTQDRLEIWRRSVELWKEKPVQGHGLASWKIHFLKYGNENLKSADNLTFYQRPHNIYLEFLSETGIVSLIFFAAPFVFFIVGGIYYLRKKGTSAKDKIWGIFLISCLTGYLSYSFFSFPNERTEQQLFLSLIFVMIIGLLSNFSSTKNSKISISNLSYLFCIILLLGVSYLGVLRLQSEKHVSKALAYKSEGKLNNMKRYMLKAKSPFYSIDSYSTPLDWYIGLAYFAEGDIENAKDHYQKAYMLNPYHVHTLNNLGSCYALQKNHQKAIELYEKALNISPNFEDALYNIIATKFSSGAKNGLTGYLRQIKEPKDKARHLNTFKVLYLRQLQVFVSGIEQSLLKNQLNYILTEDDWLINIFLKSISNNVSMQKQLLLDALYTLELDNSVSKEQSERIKLKYKYL